MAGVLMQKRAFRVLVLENGSGYGTGREVPVPDEEQNKADPAEH